MRQRGIALVIALATVLVVSGIGTLLFLRTLGEIRHSGQDQGIVQTLMLARGAANAGGTFLSTTARDRLSVIVRATASTTDLPRWPPSSKPKWITTFALMERPETFRLPALTPR